MDVCWLIIGISLKTSHILEYPINRKREKPICLLSPYFRSFLGRTPSAQFPNIELYAAKLQHFSHTSKFFLYFFLISSFSSPNFANSLLSLCLLRPHCMRAWLWQFCPSVRSRMYPLETVLSRMGARKYVGRGAIVSKGIYAACIAIRGWIAAALRRRP